MRFLLVVGMGAIVVSLGAVAVAASEKDAVTMPEAVARTFEQSFPDAEIVKLDAEVENGVVVYDIEFRDGKVEKETDITADGTMLEFTIVVGEADVPAPAMAALQEAAEGAAIRRIEEIELHYEIRDGKVAALPKPVTNYEALLSRGEAYGEVVVSSSGALVEAVKWSGKREEDHEEEGGHESDDGK